MTWFQHLSSDEQRAALDLLDTPAGRHAGNYAGADTAFAAWLATADKLSIERYSLSIFDLPDFLWRDHHDDGMTPEQALAAAIEYTRES